MVYFDKHIFQTLVNTPLLREQSFLNENKRRKRGFLTVQIESLKYVKFFFLTPATIRRYSTKIASQSEVDSWEFEYM